jgi:intein-encoded DNA endonuclease-like protein
MPVLKSYNKDFFKAWSSDMAYILGFLYADGNIVETKRGTHFVALYIADEEILTAIKECLESNHKISKRSSATGAVYRLQIGSKEWFEDLAKIGLFPNKTKRMLVPKVPKKYFGDFVRGYFDGDGNVWSGFVHKNRHNPLLVLQLSFTSGSVEFLESLHTQLQYFGIKGGGIYKPKSGNYGRLTFSSRDTLTIYKIMYNGAHRLYLPRKKQVFEKFVNCGGSSTG